MPSKQTKRERKELARQRKLEEMRRAQRRRALRKFKGIGTVVAVAAVIFGLFWLTGRSGREATAAVNDLAAPAGCSEVQEPEYGGREHLTEGEPPPSYSSVPPTSGKHAPGPETTGVHTTPIADEVQVHNLEHGHIGIQYHDISDELLEGLEEIVEGNDDWSFIAPKPDMPPKLALTAWTRLVTCDDPQDAEAALALTREFTKQFQQNGPEKIPG